MYFFGGLGRGGLDELEPALNSRANKLAKETDEIQNYDKKKHFLWLVKPFTKVALFGYNPFNKKDTDHYRANSYLRLR